MNADLFRMRARLPAFRRKVDQALETIHDALERMQSPYVAFSAGKDSSVVLHLVRRVAPDTVAVWSDDEYNYPETVALVDATPNCHRIAARVQHADWFTAWEDGPQRIPPGTVWVDASANDGLQTYARQQGYDGAFIGLRADENSRRRHYLSHFGLLHYADKHGAWQCNPIGWWSVEDVWSYIHTYNVPCNAAYDRLSQLGVALERQRVGPLAVERALGYGQLAILKRGWPDLYNRFVAAYPEASAYV